MQFGYKLNFSDVLNYFTAIRILESTQRENRVDTALMPR